MAVNLEISNAKPIELSVNSNGFADLSVGVTTTTVSNDYDLLQNKPQINGVEIIGNKSLNEFGAYTQAQTDEMLLSKADKSEIPSLNGYATESWVESKGYLTEHQSLVGYATEQWVENKHYLTEHQSLSDYYTKTQTDNLLDDKADASDVPTKTSQLTNDSGYITDAGVTSWNNQTGAVTFAESDPTVPSWAKSPNKPTYTASEVGAVPTTRKVNNKALSADIALTASDVGALPNTTAIPSKTSDLTNDSGFLTSAPVTSVNGSTGAVTINVPTKTSELRNNGDGAGGVFVTDTQLPAKISLVLDDYLANAQMYATDATSKAVLSQAFGFDAEIVVPSNLTSTTALLYKLEPRTWFCWMNGTEMEFARMSVSVNTSNSAITLYLRGRTSIATGIMGVDSAWTVSEILPIYNGGVS